MAVSHGKVATEETVFKQYIGIAAVNVMALNPTLEELKKLTHTSKDEEPSYIGTAKVKDSKGEEVEVPQIRLTFYCHTDPKMPTNQGIDTIIQFPIFLGGGYQYSTKHGLKVKVIDKYGRTAWATEEEVKAHKIPEYANGPANLDAGYHPCFIGEDQLVNFIQCYLNIPPIDKWDNEKQSFSLRENPEQCECELEHIKDYFKGDISEIKEILAYQPENRIKIICGVRTDDKGTIYQTVYTQGFARLASTNYKYIEKQLLQEASTEYGKKSRYSVGKLVEFKETPTDYSEAPKGSENETDSADPFKESAPLAGGTTDDLLF